MEIDIVCGQNSLFFVRIINPCSVENPCPDKSNEPVKVSENNLSGNFLLPDLEYP
jgi:hypothetical protein